MKKILVAIILMTSVYATQTTQVTIADLKEATFLIIKDLKNTSNKLADLSIRLTRVEANLDTSGVKASLKDLQSKYNANIRSMQQLNIKIDKKVMAPQNYGSSIQYNTTIDKPQNKMTYNKPIMVKSKPSMSISYDNYPTKKSVTSVKKNTYYHPNSVVKKTSINIKSKYDDEILEFIENNGY